MLELKHAMRPELRADERARQNFVAGLRAFVLNDLADDMRVAYESRIRPQLERRLGRPPASGPEVHRAMRADPMFQLYSALRVNAQRMVWDSVVPVVEREKARLSRVAGAVRTNGSLDLDPSFEVPRNVTAIDVHLMPGSYARQEGPDDLGAGAIYDQGLAVFSFGLMGENLDDIGRSMAHYIRRRYPEFRPRAILDIGCTIGHNTVPWAKAYPEADTHAVDAAAPGLRYGHARAALQGASIHFHQMNAERLAFPNGSFDLVFSSMFLHELSVKTIGGVFREARRVLKPGGLMLHMELPPNGQMSAYDSFYLDWDCYYNQEPFYKAYRDQDPKALCVAAGFDADKYIQFVVPSLGFHGEAAVDAAIDADAGEVDSDKTGRLADGVQWFGFGAWT
ncbi:MAG TPA: class I SAM-dependent methyltransferase [Alphaproteobacteria bacterium]|nr:class I SAM-dependent methyltransferase [Alphaproteobacteria bacterium]